ncbi:MAG: hypothetical protein AAGJ93_08000 [Bacteroidota bacterium]
MNLPKMNLTTNQLGNYVLCKITTLLFVVSFPTIVFCQPFQPEPKLDEAIIRTMLGYSLESRLSFEKRSQLSNAIIDTATVIIKGTVLLEEDFLKNGQIPLNRTILMDVQVLRGSYQLDSLRQATILRLLGDKDGVDVENETLVYKRYSHGYNWGIYKGNEYVFFCRKVAGKLIPIIDQKITYLQKGDETDYWFGLYGIVFRSTAHLNNHFRTFENIKMIKP